MPIISGYFPKLEHFYDLFGGGFSVTHYMLENKKNNYNHFHYNEIRPGICELIKDAIDGKYNFNNFKPDWIARERFQKEKESNAYIKIVWSFGNNGDSYLFGKEIESHKKSMHQAVIFNEFDDFMIKTFGINKWPDGLSVYGKRVMLKCIIRKNKLRFDLKQLEQLEQLERLQQLERLERLDGKLTLTNLDYREVKIQPNSVIYCDIPYNRTADYGREFNHHEFFNWADSQDNPVFISEYNIPDKRFTLIKQISHRTTFSVEKQNSKVIEKLYVNKVGLQKLKELQNG